MGGCAGTAPRPAARVVVGRQSIHARDLSVVGYELLFRSVQGEGPDAGLGAAGYPLSGEEMTSDVLFSSLNIGLQTLVDGKWIFFNADRALLTGAPPLTLPARRTVIEVLETVIVDDQVLAGCRRMRDHGFRLALDDFVWFPGADRLLELASIVKVDVQAVTGADLQTLLRRCRSFDVTLLAEKVETEQELAELQDMGFDLFQGYVLERPVLVPGRALEASSLARLRLAATLLGADLDIDELEDVMRGEPGLTYQILQLAALGRLGETRRRIHTLRQAVVLAGTRRIQNWIALLLARPTGSMPGAAIMTALVRARACELLATRCAPAQTPLAFAAGMLSAFDLILGVGSDELVRTLPLADDLAAAAFTASSELGRLVRDVTDRQLGAPNPQQLSDVTAAELDTALAAALSWAAHATAALDTE